MCTNYSFLLRLLCISIISFLSTVSYVEALSELVERDDGEEILSHLKDGRVCLSNNMAHPLDRGRGVVTPFLCKIMELKREKALNAWVTYYHDHPDSEILNRINITVPSNSLNQLTPIQWAVRNRWNKGIESLLPLNPNITDIIDFARRFYTLETPDEAAIEFVQIMGNYGVQKIIQRSPVGNPLMQELMVLCKISPPYDFLRQKWQEEIIFLASEGVKNAIFAFSQGGFSEDTLSGPFASYAQMLWCVYDRAEFESLWKIPSLRSNKIWREIPWQLSLENTPLDAEKGFRALKTLQQWVGVETDEYFRAPLFFSTPDFTGEILPISYTARQGMSYMLKLFIDAGALIWGNDSLKNTPLHHAVMAHKVNGVRLLTNHVKEHEGLQRCIELITTLNQDSLSPMDLAVRELCLVDNPDKRSIREIYDVLSSIREEGDRGEGREQRYHIHADPNLKGFYEGFQRQMNIMLLAHQVIQTGLVARSPEAAGLLEQGIMLAGENIPFPGASLAARLLSKTIGVYRQGRQDDQTQTLAGLFVSPTATSDAVESLSRDLVLSYEESLSKLTSESIDAFSQSLVKRVLTYWSEYDGLPGIDEMTNIKLYLSTDETGLKKIIESIRERMPRFVRTYLLKDTLLKITGSEEVISDRQFLMGIGICERYPSESTNRYSRMHNPTTPYAPFGYRLGTRDEAERLFFSQIRVIDGLPRREEYVSLGSILTGLPTEVRTVRQIAAEAVKIAAGVVMSDVAAPTVTQLFAQDSPKEGALERAKEGVKSLVVDAADLERKVEEVVLDAGSNAQAGNKKCPRCTIS